MDDGGCGNHPIKWIPWKVIRQPRRRYCDLWSNWKDREVGCQLLHELIEWEVRAYSIASHRKGEFVKGARCYR